MKVFVVSLETNCRSLVTGLMLVEVFANDSKRVVLVGTAVSWTVLLPGLVDAEHLKHFHKMDSH